MKAWSWAAAACKGTSHAKSGTRLQDAKCCFAVEGPEHSTFIGIVSDGAGSASMGGQGASLVCRTISFAAKKHFSSTNALPSQIELESWVDALRDRIFLTAQRRNLSPKDFAATMIIAISNGESSLVAHIGDGCAVFKTASDKWVAPIWPAHGEFASTTYFVTDEISPRLNIAVLNEGIVAIVAFTDGIERLALDFLNKEPYQKFFDGITRPLFSAPGNGKNMELSAALNSYLNSASINDRTDDDKTLVIAVRK